MQLICTATFSLTCSGHERYARGVKFFGIEWQKIQSLVEGVAARIQSDRDVPQILVTRDPVKAEFGFVSKDFLAA